MVCSVSVHRSVTGEETKIKGETSCPLFTWKVAIKLVFVMLLHHSTC